MIGAIIGALITGGIIGALGRLLLPGGQDIGWPKTIGLGVVANLLVSIVLGSIIDGWIIGVIVGAVVAAGLLWLGIRQGFLKPAAS